MQAEHVLWFDQVRIADVASVGGKNASLGEMIGTLRNRGVRVPDGFATTAEAYRCFVDHNKIAPKLADNFARLRAGQASLEETGSSSRALFLEGEYPPELSATILTAYEAMSEGLGRPDPAVAVRSSATAEDLPTASFAGQQETFLNVRGGEPLLVAVKRCFASLYTDRAISYRDAQKIDQLVVALSVGVQQMVRSDLGSAGVMFSIDTKTGFPEAAVISANWGLGETVVQGSVDPDEYTVFKPLLGDTAKRPIIERTRGSKAKKLVY